MDRLITNLTKDDVDFVINSSNKIKINKRCRVRYLISSKGSEYLKDLLCQGRSNLKRSVS